MEDNLNNRIYKAKMIYDNQSLDNRFDKISTVLTDAERFNLFGLLSKGCKARAKRKIMLLLQVPLHAWYNYGIYNRVEFKNNDAFYCTGQDWHSERKTLLKCIEGYYD